MPQDLRGDEAAEWILSAQKRPPARPESPFTQSINATPTAPNPQTGPAYLPPQSFAVPPMPPAPFPPAQAGTTNIRLGDWLSGGWKIYSQNWLLMSMATLLAWLLGSVTFGIGSVIFGLTSISILAGPLLMGLFRMAFKTMRQERPEIGDLFNWQGRFWQVFLMFVLFAVIHLGVSHLTSNGFFSVLITYLLVTPFLTVLTGLTTPYLLERKTDAPNAINDVSRVIFSRDAVMWWVVGLVFLTLSAAGLAGCGIGAFVTVPWMVSSAAVAYRDLFGVDDPNRTNQ
ncbi:MAG TPA: hypothetical protein VJZ91_07495 [Blastocatellia bacterium]|nr:hypothetical protein [Blastocatellia bacterium]